MRRIIAFTSKKAKQAIHLADSYAKRIKKTEGLTGAALEKLRCAEPKAVGHALVSPPCSAYYTANIQCYATKGVRNIVRLHL